MPASASATPTLLAAFETHYAELIRYITRRTGNVDEARSLAHDTWLRIAERQLDMDAAPNDPRAYLFTISHNVTMNHLRRGHWMTSYLAECEQIDAGAPAQTPDVADSAMYRQALVVVEKALTGLSPRMRDTYLANGLHGEKQADIAARLGVSLNTVERDIAQAARCLEDALHAWRNTRESMARSKPSGRRKSLAALLGVFAMGVGGTAVWHHLQREALRFQIALATLRGRQLQRGLPDGSELTLDALSRVEVDYTAERRLVRLLDGAAFFTVQRDESRPFIVEAQGVQVTVLGTRFGVEIDGEDGVLVQVESGRVRVDAGTQTDELTAGQSLRAFAGRLQRDDIARPAAWRHGELQFHDMPLAQALARVQRYSATRLMAAPSAARLRISGELRVADAGDWLASLPRVLPVRLKTLQDGSLEVAVR